uniref:WD40 repeat domain-containing protein n=1 Tax=Streptomyces chartreusis TaxID=1969 RepID=UPI003F490C15
MSDVMPTEGVGTAFADADGRLTDPGFLVNADPSEVLGLLDAASGPAARLAAAVYRASAHLHRTATAGVRRQLLALDAARYGGRALSARITRVSVADEPAALWGVEWATGSQVDARFRCVLTGHNDNVEAIATVKVDGRPHVVSTSGDGTMRLWDLATGDQVGTPFAGAAGMGVAAIATVVIDGRPCAVTLSNDRRARVWDLVSHERAEPVRVFRLPSRTSPWALTAVVVDGRPCIVTGTEDGAVQVWDLGTGQQVGDPLTGHTGQVSTVATTVIDGRPHIVTGSTRWRDGTVRVWDLTTGRQVCEPLTGHTADVNAVATTTIDGRPCAVTGAANGEVRVWDLATGQQVGEPLAHIRAVNAVATVVIDSHPHAVTVGWGGTVRLWDLTSSEQVGEPLDLDASRVDRMAITVVNGRPCAVTVGFDSHRAWELRVWDLSSGQQVGEPRAGHSLSVVGAATGEVGGQPLAVTGGGAVCLWNLNTGEPVGEFPTRDLDSVSEVVTAVVEGSQRVVTGSGDGSVRTWDLATRQQLGMFKVHRNSYDDITSMAAAEVNGQSYVLISTIEDEGAPGLWDLSTGRRIGGLYATGWPGSISRVLAVSTSVIDNRPIAVTSCENRRVQVWDLTTMCPVTRLVTAPVGRVLAAGTVVVDGRPLVVTGGEDTTVRLWDLTTGEQVGEPLTGHAADVTAVATTTIHDRPHAVTGSGDGTVRVWDLAKGAQAEPELPFPFRVYTVAVTSDGRLVVGFGKEVAVLAPRRPNAQR